MMLRLIRITLLSFVVLIVAGCTTPFSTKANISTPTTPLASTATPPATPSLSLEQVRQACGTSFAPQGVQGEIDGLAVALIQPFGLAYPGIKLPDNMTPDKPYAFTRQLDSYHPTPDDLLADFGQYAVSICNASQSEHKIVSLGMKVAAFTPDTNSSNIMARWSVAMSSVQRNGTEGCGGSLGPYEVFLLAWPAHVGIGTENSSITQTNVDIQPTWVPTPNGPGYGYLPITIPPGHILSLDLVNPTTNWQPGTYQFQFGIQEDTVPLRFLEAPIAPVFLASKAQMWSGNACYESQLYMSEIPKTGHTHRHLGDPEK
jgi:hypothetical protein